MNETDLVVRMQDWDGQNRNTSSDKYHAEIKYVGRKVMPNEMLDFLIVALVRGTDSEGNKMVGVMSGKTIGNRRREYHFT